MSRKRIETLMGQLTRMSHDHQVAMNKLCNLLDDEYGPDAYDRISQHLDGDTLFVEALNYGGQAPSLETLDRMWKETEPEGGDA